MNEELIAVVVWMFFIGLFVWGILSGGNSD